MLSEPEPIKFWAGTFNTYVDNLIDRFHGRQLRLDIVDLDETLAYLEKARSTLGLADTAAVRRMLARNPSIIQIAREPHSNEDRGLFAYLPLNDYGAWAVLTGSYDGRCPDPAWIACEREVPVALVVWLIIAPDHLGRLLEPIARLFRELCPQGCPILSHGATTLSHRIQRSMGFRPAPDFFPYAPARLMAAIPDSRGDIDTARSGERRKRKCVTVRIARSLDDLHRVFAVRSATYQAEQLCPFDEEFDGNDLCATQFLAMVGGDAAGCIRVRYFGDFVKLERLAVRREFRDGMLSSRLISAALQHCRRKGFTRVYGHSRADLLAFWQKHGFVAMKGRRPFFFSDVEYVEVEATLPPDPIAIRFGVDPMMSIRPEGEWHIPGPLDRSLIRASLAWQ